MVVASRIGDNPLDRLAEGGGVLQYTALCSTSPMQLPVYDAD